MDGELDIEQPEQLLAYLRAEGRIAANEVPELRVLAGGVSNRTVLLRRPDGEAWVLKQALYKLRVQADWFSSPERIEREAAGMRWLRQLAPPGTIVELVFEDPARHVLAMAAVPEPHANWKQVLLAGQIDLGHVAQFGQLIGSVHHAAALRRPKIEPAFADRSFFESLRVEPYYSYSASQVPAAAAFYARLIAATRLRLLTLVHGDYSPKNVLVSANRLVLLDHEVIHWGDPAFDLGFALTHLLSKAHHLAPLRQEFAAAACHFWQSYCTVLDAALFAGDLEGYVVRHTLGCLLARVAGRSPLEYLDAAARERQRAAVLGLIDAPPPTVAALVEGFIMRL